MRDLMTHHKQVNFVPATHEDDEEIEGKKEEINSGSLNHMVSSNRSISDDDVIDNLLSNSSNTLLNMNSKPKTPVTIAVSPIKPFQRTILMVPYKEYINALLSMDSYQLATLDPLNEEEITIVENFPEQIDVIPMKEEEKKHFSYYWDLLVSQFLRIYAKVKVIVQANVTEGIILGIIVAMVLSFYIGYKILKRYYQNQKKIEVKKESVWRTISLESQPGRYIIEENSKNDEDEYVLDRTFRLSGTNTYLTDDQVKNIITLNPELFELKTNGLFIFKEAAQFNKNLKLVFKDLNNYHATKSIDEEDKLYAELEKRYEREVKEIEDYEAGERFSEDQKRAISYLDRVEQTKEEKNKNKSWLEDKKEPGARDKFRAYWGGQGLDHVAIQQKEKKIGT